MTETEHTSQAGSKDSGYSIVPSPVISDEDTPATKPASSEPTQTDPLPWLIKCLQRANRNSAS
ncbi:hypothetical protein Pla22_24200 [Rubripirellula amarantea]|uniref:Uncharacterized protein n=1 Tax=Rubripirellula amarantea TaxID=2527999 RepID=A0A5C5WVL9_9BACT|nr:hypothetical protein [Rubripirellula amarantea]TWT54767.1 hypothetical protein Pla22_24200 [Rubripirellula amarantea]